MSTMPEDRKQYLREYKERNIKRIPLEINYDAYIKLLQHIGLYGEKKSVNGYIKYAIALTMEIEEAGIKEDVLTSLKLRNAIKRPDDNK